MVKCVVKGGMRGIRRDTVNERALRILLECILVSCKRALKISSGDIKLPVTLFLLWDGRNIEKQECIPVGCVPSASVATSKGVSGLARGGSGLHMWGREVSITPHEQNDRRP